MCFKTVLTVCMGENETSFCHVVHCKENLEIDRCQPLGLERSKQPDVLELATVIS